ncbi:ATP-dependent RNA helicase-like protein DB10 [Impatiens glandulifera]|uniref:ATP-dependent RNA helicase-like protein DB10 n=1 Tax=Impatiens glandulifera TaxID=253017 RepID=UPI001FB11711|nr:ATP-dependent RNA helicase-like protein DB10 [Impatiens glandulifera]
MATTETVLGGIRYAPEDPTLPKPWRGLVDGKTGYLYYWNPETNITQYERPGASSQLVSGQPHKTSAPISSSVQVQKSSDGQLNGNNYDNGDKFSRGDGNSKHVSVTRSVQNSRVLENSHTVANGLPSAGYGEPSSKGHGSLSSGNASSADYCRRHEITVMGDDVPPPITSFEASGIPSEMLREVQLAGFSAPTPIQAQSWPVALQARDIVAIAKTGSGKTLGYLIPGFIHIKRSRSNPQLGPTVLVLSPTRELATQIQAEAVKFGKSSRISCTCLYGGAPKGPQLRDLDRGADIVVATPGRLNDILEMRRVSLRQVSYLVLDEADRMLDMGFEPQIRKIVNELPSRRQTLMYTATWPKEVRKIAADLLVNPVQVNIGNVDELVANKAITQHIEILSPMEKNKRIEQILRSQEPGSKVIIFCSTKKMCDRLARDLTRNFGAAAIHGDKSQADRDYVLNQFRNGRSPILVATDVAARGLDIKDIRVVINYDFPTGIEDYVHRIGRTGRAGATGIAHTFFCEQDVKHASDLVKILEGSNQRVPVELQGMAMRSKGMGRARRPWGTGSTGRGGRIGSGYGDRDNNNGRGGGRWGPPVQDRGVGRDSRDWNGRSYDNGNAPSSLGIRGRSRSRSRSPNRVGGSGWGRSIDKGGLTARERSPPLKRVKDEHYLPPSRFTENRSPSYRSDPMRELEAERVKKPLKATSPAVGGGRGAAVTAAYYGEEEEEGMIHDDGVDDRKIQVGNGNY